LFLKKLTGISVARPQNPVRLPTARLSIFFYDLISIIFKTVLGSILMIQYGLIFAALMCLSDTCSGTEVGIQPQDGVSGPQAPGGAVELSKPGQGEKTQKPQHEAEKAGINDLLGRMPDVKMEKAKKAYQAGLAKCPEKDTLEFLKTVLESLRWWKDIEENGKEEIRKQTAQGDMKDEGDTLKKNEDKSVDLDKEFLDVVSSGNAKKIISIKAAFDRMLKDVRQGKSLKKIEKKEEKDSDKILKKKGKPSKKKRSLLDDYGYDSSAGDEYEEGSSLSEELELEHDLDEEAESFRVHDFQIDGDSIDTRNDWEEAKNNPWDGKTGVDAADSDEDDKSASDEDAEPED
jgi:hypothetical protein